MRTPRFIHNTLFACTFALAATVAMACDDGGDGGDTQAENGDGNGTGEGDGDDDSCEGSSSGSVYGDNEQCPEYVSCVDTNCGTQYETCFGPGYLSGNFGGTCADYMSCINACECDDQDCQTDCYNTHAAMGTPCGDCLLNEIAICVVNSCSDAAMSCA